MNLQAPTHPDRTNGTSILLHSIFNTIQGEGPHVGRPACFIRLAGCNLQCPACDTEYTEGAKRVPVEDLARRVREQFPHDLVVITGGEPFRQNILPLVEILVGIGFSIQIETNGTLAPQGDLERWIDLVCKDHAVDLICSPKAGRVKPVIINLVCWSEHGAFKYVIDSNSFDASDGLPILALDHPASPKVWRDPFHRKVPTYLQPVDTGDPERNTINRQLAVELCQKFGYRLSIQLHKVIGVP